MPASTRTPAFSRHDVTAVLVTHDGERWLPRVLPALHGQERPWQRLVVADTTSADSTRDLLASWVAADHLATLPRTAGYGEAVAAAVALADTLAADDVRRVEVPPAPAVDKERASSNGSGPHGPVFPSPARRGRHGRPAPEELPTAAEAAKPDEDARPDLAPWNPDAPVEVSGPPVQWLWLIHDDCEPDPDALYHLLARVDDDPSLAVVGPKVRGWYQRRLLLEMGVTIDGDGRRDTGLERGEQDQGQHDRRKETLAVSSAGMLVRRDVWDALGGFDPNLAMMRDDVDLCWRAWLGGHKVAVVPAAVVYHAEAAANERRPVDAGSGRMHHLDRAGALRVLLANLPTRRFALAMPRLVVGTILRVIGLLLAKLPRQAGDELRALGTVLFRPRAVLAMRSARREGHKISATSLRRLFPPPGHQVRQGMDAIAGAVAGRRSAVPIGRHRAAEGLAADEPENPDLGAGGVVLRRILRSPGWVLVLGLVVLTLLAGRDLLAGGALLGGALLPAADGAGALWSQYVSDWHPAGVGSGSAAPPYLAVVAAVGSVLAGKAGLAVTVLLLGSVPLAGLCAYVASRALPTSRTLRVWASAAYALVPVLTGAVAAGRLGSAVATALLPLLALASARAVGTPGRPGTGRGAWTAALLLAVLTAFAPLSWILAVLLAGGVVATVGRADRELWNRLAIVVGAPLVLLLPWSGRLLLHPSLFLAEPGPPGPGLADDPRGALQLLLLSPGGPGSAPVWTGACLVLAGLAGLALGARRGLLAGAWAVAGVGFGVALVVSRLHVAAASGGAPEPAWPGVAMAVAALGVLVAAATGAHGSTQRLAARDFGLAQSGVLALAALAVAAPAVAGLSWAWRGAEGPVHRADAVLVPAHVAAESRTVDRPRTLVLRANGAESLSYALVRGAGPRLGDVDGATAGAAYRRLDALVGDVVSGRGGAQVERLADFAVRYVLVQAPVDDALARALDLVPGLERMSAPGGDGLWRLGLPVARLRLVSGGPGGPGRTLALPAGLTAATAEIAAKDRDADAEQRIVLSEPADPRWKATFRDETGKSTRLVGERRDGWAQAFVLPPGGAGRLTLSYADPARGLWMFSQASVLLVMVVLALPGGRARRDDDEDEAAVVLPDADRPVPARRHAREPGPDAASPTPHLAGAPRAGGTS